MSGKEDEMSELKPCPFCGEPVVFNKFAEKVVCEDCGATIYSDYWNTRPIEDALSARIAELEAAQRWIPVGEQLPDPNDGHNVFVLTVEDLDDPRIYGVGYGSYYIGKDCLPSWSLDFDAYGNFVTHWMPIPEPPEVK